tara:strand:- start:366 stop:602 length:237 start_codon:yes stop_codon:yes gene_type:complete
MKASINAQTITITGKLNEGEKIQEILRLMAKEINSICIMEFYGESTGHDMVELTACYSSDEATVATVKESYSDAKKAA